MLVQKIIQKPLDIKQLSVWRKYLKEPSKIQKYIFNLETTVTKEQEYFWTKNLHILLFDIPVVQSWEDLFKGIRWCQVFFFLFFKYMPLNTLQI